ncbi:MAG: hypothetical protein HY703_10770 [Gemmatimonadetes bacterium]|nr:hypothetical protein [Gemmatimonadota bacterium]
MARTGVGGGAPFRFRVSDVLDVPLRGTLLRLRLVEGGPRLADLRPGRALRLQGPGGEERVVRILAFSATGGRPSQKRLERTRELDVIISSTDGLGAGRAVQIGWFASGLVQA